jgi:hypothetical protein
MLTLMEQEASSLWKTIRQKENHVNITLKALEANTAKQRLDLNNQTGYVPTTFELAKPFNRNIKPLIDAQFHNYI